MSQANPRALQCEGVPWTAASFFVCRMRLLGRLLTVADDYNIFSKVFFQSLFIFNNNSYSKDFVIESVVVPMYYKPFVSHIEINYR